MTRAGYWCRLLWALRDSDRRELVLLDADCATVPTEGTVMMHLQLSLYHVVETGMIMDARGNVVGHVSEDGEYITEDTE